ncbi:MAK10-like protein [Tanacetum coccineum]
MGDVNPIRTLGDYSKPSHEGHMNTIELSLGNNVSEDPNQHLKDFLKLLDSLDLDGSITTWEDLTTRFLAQFFPPGRTAKICNDILMFQQHHGESLSEAWTRFKDLLQKVPHHGIDLWLQLRDRNAEESWALLEDLALYEDKSWNDPRDFAKTVKAISLPQDVPMNKITYSCEICSVPHDTQYCMENPKQAFVDYASSRTDEMRSRQFAINQGPRNFNEAANTWKGKPNFNWAHGQTFTSPHNGSFSTYSSNYQTKLEKALIDFDSHQEKRLSSLRAQRGQQQDDMIGKINLLNPSSPKCVHFVNSIVILNKEDKAKEEGDVKTSITEYEDHEMTVESKEEFEEETEEEIKEEEEDSPKHFDTFLTMKELRLGPRRKPSNPGKIYDFIERVKGLKVFVRNFTYECDFMMLEDTISVIDHDLGSIVFRKPFVEATGLVYDREEGTITFEKDKENIVFKMPHKMEMFKHIDFTNIKADRIPPFVIESDNDSSRKTHYSDSLYLRPEYKHDENVCRAIRSLIAMKDKKNEGEVT